MKNIYLMLSVIMLNKYVYNLSKPNLFMQNPLIMKLRALLHVIIKTYNIIYYTLLY